MFDSGLSTSKTDSEGTSIIRVIGPYMEGILSLVDVEIQWYGFNATYLYTYIYILY
jgi:hypothetical protein